MFAVVFHGEAKITTALVKIQRARLKNRLLLPSIEITEGNEIIAKLGKVSMVVNQLVEPCDGFRVRLLGFILGDERCQRVFGLASQDFSNTFEPDLLH